MELSIMGVEALDQLHFITTSSDPEIASQDAESRRLIRKIATRTTRSKKVYEFSERHRAQSDAVRQSTQRDRMTRFRAGPKKHTPASKVAALPTTRLASPISTQVCVWDPVIAPLGGEAWNLLHYYRFSFRARSWAINAKKDWFAFIIEDQAATHATLSFVSLNRDLEEGSSVSQSTLHHRTKALQLIRRQLTSMDTLPKDSLIGAIALLAITEGLEGHSSASALHIQALEKLVSLRGGLGNLHHNEALSRLVAWADLCHTSTFSCRRRLPRLFKLSDLNLKINGGLSLSLEVTSFQNSINEYMGPLMNSLVKLLAAVPRYPPNDETSVSQRQEVSRLIYHLNQHVLSMYHDRSAFNCSPSGQISKILCYATYLYISLVLRQMPKRTKIVVERARKLWDAIEESQCDLSSDIYLKQPYILISLWANVLHYCALAPHEREGAAVKTIVQAMATLEISTVKMLEQKLALISWISGYAAVELQSLYDVYCHGS